MQAFRTGPKVYLIAAVLLFGSAVTYADPSPQDGNWTEWQEAKNLYDAGKYEEALRAFRSHPAETAQYFHNIGTIYLKMAQPGQALAYLAKANHLKAHDSETQNNLRLAQTALGRLIGNEKLDPASSWLEVLADRVSLDELRGILGMMGLIVAALWFRAYLRTRHLRRTLLQPAGFIGMIGVAITGGLYCTERLAESHPPGFVVERQVVRSGPGNQFIQLTQVEAGVKLRLLGPGSTAETAEHWSQVRYSEDSVGWILTSSLLLL